ncbi:hypothetical protein GCM10009532_22510 [Microbacterium aurantiacum]
MLSVGSSRSAASAVATTHGRMPVPREVDRGVSERCHGASACGDEPPVAAPRVDPDPAALPTRGRRAAERVDGERVAEDREAEESAR